MTIGHKAKAPVRESTMKMLAICAFAALAFAAKAQTSFVETPLFSTAEFGIGHEYRAQLRAAMRSIGQGDLQAAESQLAPIREYCKSQQRPNRRIVSVADTVEYDAWMASTDSKEPTEWIDIACPSAYYATGFMLAGARRMDEALPWLDAAIAMAPYFPDAWNERGFVLGQTGRFTEAMAAYHHALDLARTHDKAKYIQPTALRGIGFVLTETGDLDGAQKAYEESQKYDPDSEVARNELEYIAQQRAKH